MERAKSVLITSAIALFVLLGLGAWTDARAKAQFAPGESATATKEEVGEVLGFFDALEEAVVREDLDAVMDFYSEKYQHLGIQKSVVRSLWENIFEKYDNIKSVHAFTKMVVVDDEGLVVCTGTLLGVPAGSKGSRHVTIDSWVEQNHYILKTKGSWKIVGGSSHRMMEDKSLAGKDKERQLGFHPLY